MYPYATKALSIALLLLCFARLAEAEDVDLHLVQMGSTWKYLDDGSDQGTAWRERAYSDGSWPVGPAQLGYGDGDEATVVGYGGNSDDKHITTYFRHHFTVNNRSAITELNLSLLRDDGAVVYLNGVEIVRSNMPGASVDYLTQASGGASEGVILEYPVDPSLLIGGDNLLAVEIHQVRPTSSDISFDCSLIANPTPPIGTVARGPYLQLRTSSSMVIRWRTASATDSRVRYGLSQDGLSFSASDGAITTEHEVTVGGLLSNTQYYYTIGSTSNDLVGPHPTLHFKTAPAAGSPVPTRVWVIGDSGTKDNNARAVRDAYKSFTASQSTDVWLLLGDNAYSSGTDAEYQKAVFDMYPELLRTTVPWAAIGNHEANSNNGSPHYTIFTNPANGEAGGVASGSERYFSFDHANVHFVCLDSATVDRDPLGPMATWLRQDLNDTTQGWIIAFWHHPPYSKGSHNSDNEGILIDMRENFLPILEEGGVDLILAGHSHTYERSMMIDGHYGKSSSFNNTHVKDGGLGRDDQGQAYQKDEGSHLGTVYAVAGNSGKVSSGYSLNHPVMIDFGGKRGLEELGSMVLEIQGGAHGCCFPQQLRNDPRLFYNSKGSAERRPG